MIWMESGVVEQTEEVVSYILIDGCMNNGNPSIYVLE
jgi:hypothetical protein